jgi:hypothetical protein
MKIVLISLLILLTASYSFAAQVYTTKIAYDGSGNPEYIGKAPTGTSILVGGWQIKKLVYGVSGVTDVLWCNGDNNSSYVWNDRASLTYK